MSQYIKDLVDNLGKIHETANENFQGKQERQKDLYDLKNYKNSCTVEEVAYKRD